MLATHFYWSKFNWSSKIYMGLAWFGGDHVIFPIKEC